MQTTLVCLLDLSSRVEMLVSSDALLMSSTMTRTRHKTYLSPRFSLFFFIFIFILHHAPPRTTTKTKQMERSHEAAEANHRWFSNVNSGGFRRDLRLELCPPVLDVMARVLGPEGIGGALALSPLTERAQLCELAALVSDKGARAQKLHADTRDGDGDGGGNGGGKGCGGNGGGNGGSSGSGNGGDGGGDEGGHRVLLTCFVALQDVTEDMGPTWIAPRTHCGAAHEALARLGGDSAGGRSRLLLLPSIPFTPPPRHLENH